MFQFASKDIRPIWGPVDYASAGDTLRVGQIVQSVGDGFAPLGAATGAYDTTDKKVPFGIVLATSNAVPVFDSTYNADYITSVASQAAQLARENASVGGSFPKNDRQAFVQVGMITPETVIMGRLFNGAFGTLMSVINPTAASSTGASLDLTSSSPDVTPVADNATVFFRSGNNESIYRNVSAIASSVVTLAVAAPYGILTTDDMVIAPLRMVGPCKAQFDTESCFIDAAAALTTNYYGINILRLDLSEAGKEVAYFTFNPAQLSLR